MFSNVFFDILHNNENSQHLLASIGNYILALASTSHLDHLAQEISVHHVAHNVVTKTCKENYILVLKTCRVPLTKINFQPAIPQRKVSMAVTNRNIKCKLLLVRKSECLEKYCS